MTCYPKIHRVFHCSQLKLCHGGDNRLYVPLSMVTNEIGPVMQSLSILLHSRIILKEGQRVTSSPAMGRL